MLLGKYYISDHALDRYDERVNMKKRATIIESIKRDLRTLNIRNIIRKDNTTHIFTRNYKEFIFTTNKKGILCLKTIIKRNFTDNPKVIEKRKNSVN